MLYCDNLDGERTFDIVLAVIASSVLPPVMGVILLLIWLPMGRPVLVRRERPDHGGKPFEMIEVRTRSAESEADQALLPDEERLSALGRRLTPGPSSPASQ